MHERFCGGLQKACATKAAKAGPAAKGGAAAPWASCPAKDIDLAVAARWAPPLANLLKDAYNGRWRLSWHGEHSMFPTVSRSWASRGPRGEHESLRLCLQEGWRHLLAVTGKECPWPELMN